jgi:hypothetical protein
METILGFFGNVLSGGVTGLLGVALQRWADYKNKQLDIELQKGKQAHELAIMEREWQGRVKVAETEGAARVDAEDAKTLAASYAGAFDRFATWDMKAEPWYFKIWFVLLDFLRGLVRPGLTVYLCVLTTLIYFEARALLGGENLTASDAINIQTRIVDTILYLMTTCVLWWFGTRNKDKQPGMR